MNLLQERIGRQQGIVSYCTANGIVLEAAIEDAVERDTIILIEATANQVNQFGGYTGMLPADFAESMLRLAKTKGFDERLLILGGDHLGPLTWQTEPEFEAMKKAEELVAAYVEAGFTKIHLDTSMRLADDAKNRPLTTQTIARRGARLAKRALAAWQKRRAVHPDAQELVFVIGSEVPVPGGAQEVEDSICVTCAESFVDTVTVYRNVFMEEGLEAAWDNVIAVVVQPGVEFSDSTVFQYDHDAAEALIGSLSDFNGLVFEGHSTDYQTQYSLAAMVRDGISILKVGPELTFSLREGLLALTGLEEELIAEHKRSYFRAVLDEAMCREPGYWEKYYHGSYEQKKQARMFSYLDRCRYYLGNAAVRESMTKLFANIDSANIPRNMLHQYMPAACDGLMGNESVTAVNLLKSHLKLGVIGKYQAAVEAEPIERRRNCNGK